MTSLPKKTVERLSHYRRVLMNIVASGKTHIFSHELAHLMHNTPVQVRRDIMLIGYVGSLRRGYDIKELVHLIGEIIDSEQGINAAIIGFGNLGRAFATHLHENKSKIRLVAAFDVDKDKIKSVINGVKCYSVDHIREIVKKEHIVIGIITTPPEAAATVSESLIKAGIKGILNYTSALIYVPQHVYLEEYDTITSLEKAAYFCK